MISCEFGARLITCMFSGILIKVFFKFCQFTPFLFYSDGDGIPNSFDNCPEHSNADQSDVDHDGQGKLTLFIAMEFPTRLNTIKLGWCIVYILRGHQLYLKKYMSRAMRSPTI